VDRYAATIGVVISQVLAMMPNDQLAAQIASAVYAGFAIGEVDRLEVVFPQWKPAQRTRIIRQSLRPLDPAAFPAPANGNFPLLNLAPSDVLLSLTPDYLHAQLCRAALHSLAGENEARMEAVAAAHSHTQSELASLQATQRRVRQEEITAEIIELSAGEAAIRARLARHARRYECFFGAPPPANLARDTDGCKRWNGQCSRTLV
jgi:ATP synthase F1 gamma subunit